MLNSFGNLICKILYFQFKFQTILLLDENVFHLNCVYLLPSLCKIYYFNNDYKFRKCISICYISLNKREESNV